MLHHAFDCLAIFTSCITLVVNAINSKTFVLGIQYIFLSYLIYVGSRTAPSPHVVHDIKYCLYLKSNHFPCFVYQINHTLTQIDYTFYLIFWFPHKIFLSKRKKKIVKSVVVPSNTKYVKTISVPTLLFSAKTCIHPKIIDFQKYLIFFNFLSSKA